MIIDLTAPFPEKSVYKNPSQRDAWGSFDDSKIIPNLFSREFLENIFPKTQKGN